MDTERLAAALRGLGNSVDMVADDCSDGSQADLRDCAELVRVLARVVEGRTITQAFGSPGDWGYGTPIGEALAHRG